MFLREIERRQEQGDYNHPFGMYVKGNSVDIKDVLPGKISVICPVCHKVVATVDPVFAPTLTSKDDRLYILAQHVVIDYILAEHKSVIHGVEQNVNGILTRYKIGKDKAHTLMKGIKYFHGCGGDTDTLIENTYQKMKELNIEVR